MAVSCRPSAHLPIRPKPPVLPSCVGIWKRNCRLRKPAKAITESQGVVETRLDRLDRDLRSVVEVAGNTLAAYIGELEDRLERGKTGNDSHPSV